MKSKVTRTRAGTKSLRITIPESIVEFLNLKEGDQVDWKFETEGKKRKATLEKKN